MMISTIAIVVCVVLALMVAAVILAAAMSPGKAREALLAFVRLVKRLSFGPVVRRARTISRRIDQKFRDLMERLFVPSRRGLTRRPQDMD